MQVVEAFLADSYATVLGVSLDDYESVASGWSSLSHHELDISKQVKAFFDAHGITDDVEATVAKWRGKEMALLKRMDAHVDAVKTGETESLLMHGVLTTGEVLWLNSSFDQATGGAAVSPSPCPTHHAIHQHPIPHPIYNPIHRPIHILDLLAILFPFFTLFFHPTPVHPHRQPSRARAKSQARMRRRGRSLEGTSRGLSS